MNTSAILGLMPFRFLQELGKMVLFAITMGRNLIRRPPMPSAVLQHSYQVGIMSLPVLVTVAVFVGSNTALQGYSAFRPLGGQSLLGMFIGLAGLRELAPIIAATLIAAKVGTEMTTTLAVMRIREQIDALEVMGVSPHWYLISPRLLAIGGMLPLLVLLADFLCFSSGYLVSVHQLHVDPGAFLSNALEYISIKDIGVGIVKGGVFGVCICTISCYYGFNASGGAAGVGRAANQAVVASAVTVMMVNFVLSEIFYG